MNLFLLVIFFAAIFLIFEVLFFLYCFKWLSGAKAQREKEFARIDRERAELTELQQMVSKDLATAKKLAEESTAKLQRLGADAHAEWSEMATKMTALQEELATHSAKIIETSLQKFQKCQLQLEKSSQDAAAQFNKLTEKIATSKKILKLFDEEFPLEEIQKGLKEEKYEKAKKMLRDGADVSSICRAVGISQSEVTLLSFMG